MPSACGNSERSASRMAPEPVPRSVMRGAPAPPTRRAMSRSRVFRGEQLGLMLLHQRVDDLAQRLAFQNLRQLVEREVDAVIAHAPLREIVGADALRAVAGADLAAARGGARGIEFLPLVVVKPRAQHRHRLGAIAMLRTVLLHHHHDAGRNMSEADRGFGLVDVLTASAAVARAVDLELGLVYLEVDCLGLRQPR